MEEAKVRLRHAIKLDKDIRGLALDDEASPKQDYFRLLDILDHVCHRPRHFTQNESFHGVSHPICRRNAVFRPSVLRDKYI